MISGMVVGAGVDERIAIAVIAGVGRYMQDGTLYWIFAAMETLGIEQETMIEVPIRGHI